MVYCRINNAWCNILSSLYRFAEEVKITEQGRETKSVWESCGPCKRRRGAALEASLRAPHERRLYERRQVRSCG